MINEVVTIAFFAIFALNIYLFMKRYDLVFVMLIFTTLLFFLGIAYWGLTGTGLQPMDLLTAIYQTGIQAQSLNLHLVLILAAFASLMYITGVTEYIVNKAIEFGGSVATVAVILMYVAIFYLFMGTGWITGVFIEVATVTFPVLRAFGLDLIDSYYLTIIPVAAGMHMSLDQWAWHKSIYPGITDNIALWESVFIYPMIIGSVVFYLGYVIWRMRLTRRSKNWATDTTEVTSHQFTEKEKWKVPWYAALAPAVPLIAVLFLNWPLIPSAFLGILYMLLIYGIKARLGLRGYSELLWKGFVDGISHSVGIIVILFSTGMLFAVCASTNIKAPLSGTLTPLVPTNLLLYIPLFAFILNPLNMWRGIGDSSATGAVLVVLMRELSPLTQDVLAGLWAHAMYFKFLTDPTNSSAAYAIGSYKLDWMALLKRTFIYSVITGLVTLILLYISVTTGIFGSLPIYR